MMKRMVIALMAAALLMSGCNSQTEPAETTLPPVETTIPTEPVPSCYVENSPMERGTGGAVRQYELDAPVTGLCMLGQDLLVCTGSRNLMILDSRTLETIRTRELDHDLDWNSTSLVAGENGIAFYDAACGMYMTLDNSLITASTYVISGASENQAVINSSFDRIYYVADDGIRVMDLADGISRMLREEHSPVLSLEGLLFNDRTLHYVRRNESGEAQTCFVDAENGSLYQTAVFQGQVLSWNRNYAGRMILDHALGQSTWLVTGDLEGNLQRLDPDCNWNSALLLNNGWAVVQQSSQVGLSLYCYDMADGTRIAQITMPEQYEELTLGCADGSRLWLADDQGQRFFCWDTAISGGSDPDSCLVDYAALGRPDEAGLDQCRQLAQTIGQRHGVEITIREENNRTSGVDYSTYPDFRPDMYNEALRDLERVLRKLPENFLKNVGRHTDAGKLEIRLVDDYDPDQKATPATGSIDVTDGNAAVCVSICGDLEEIFFHELFHVMEIQIMNNQDGFKNWEETNPADFEYVNSYAPYYDGSLKKSAYLNQGSNYFADDYGLISPREDRAQVFLYACMDDQSDRFASPAMQEKLSRICRMLRDSFSVAEDQTPIWEQYLFAGESGDRTE